MKKSKFYGFKIELAVLLLTEAVLIGSLVLIWQGIKFLMYGYWTPTSIDSTIINYLPWDWYAHPQSWIGLNKIIRILLGVHPLFSIFFINVFIACIVFLWAGFYLLCAKKFNGWRW